MSGITPTGFQRKRTETILTEMQQAFRLIFGENLNVSPESPDGQVIGIMAAAYGELWEICEGAYDSYNPSAATYAALSNLVQVNGIERKEGVPSTAELKIDGITGTVILSGSSVSASDGSSIFLTDNQVTIPPTGTITVPSTCTVDGPTVAVAGTLVIIDSPITGWNSVDNLQDAVLGAYPESDSDLRARRERSVAKAAISTADAILAEVLNVDAVVQAFLYENDTGSTDVETGTPSNSFQVVVDGGDSSAVANAIYTEKPVGIQSYGTTIVQVFDSQGFIHDIGFTRPDENAIYVTVNLTTFSNFPPDGADIIKQAIIDYAEGILIPGRGFNVGDDIINSELYCPVNTVEGHTIDSLLQGLTPGPTLSDDIAAAFNQIGIFTTANIIVNESPVS